MAITIPDFRTRFTEFEDDAKHSDERIQLFIDDAVCTMGSDESRWCGKYDIAQAYLTAHYLTLGNKSATGNPASILGSLASKRVGNINLTYNTSSLPSGGSISENAYLATTYGTQYVVRLNACFGGAVTANVC